MFWGLFENYSSTATPSARKGKFLPVQAHMSAAKAIDKLINYVNDNGFENITIKKEYNDIYCEKRGFEVSFVVSFSNSVSYIEISVYGEGKRGRTRRKLKSIYKEISNLFNV